MSRYHCKTLQQMLKNLWSRKIQNIIQKYPSNEKHWPMELAKVDTLLADFAAKFPGQVDIKKNVSNSQVEGRSLSMFVSVGNIVVTVTFDKWPEDKLLLAIDPVAASANFHAVSNAGWEDGSIEVSTYAYNVDLETSLKNLEEFIKKYPKHREQAENKQNAKEKAEKLDEMGRKSIETIVPQMMSGSGYEWSLVHNEIHYILFVKMKKHKALMISLTPKNFASKITDLLNVISQMEKLFDQIPYAVDVRTYGSNILWRKGMGIAR